MKTAIILMTLIFSWMTVSQENMITATYDGLEEGSYYFTDEEGNTHSFQGMEDSVMESYDLSNESLVGRMFKISYRIEEELDVETDETYDNYIIVKLSPIQ
ncbi:MAG: hypothetical protein RIM83_08210 [Allomuricauda sp.]